MPVGLGASPAKVVSGKEPTTAGACPRSGSPSICHARADAPVRPSTPQHTTDNRRNSRCMVKLPRARSGLHCPSRSPYQRLLYRCPTEEKGRIHHRFLGGLSPGFLPALSVVTAVSLRPARQVNFRNRLDARDLVWAKSRRRFDRDLLFPAN
jgi:hypothetical protein